MEIETQPPPPSSSTELIPDLPEDLALECLLRLPYTSHSSASHVSISWCSLLQSHRFYSLRRARNRTRSLACLVQQLSPYPSQSSDVKPNTLSSSYSISVFDPLALSWSRIHPIPDFPNGLPLFCQLSSTRGKLYVLGGWDPVSYDPLQCVYAYDFVTDKWRRCRDMPGKRTFFAAAGINGRVYVAGGHDELKNALRSAWVYDVSGDEWGDIGEMSQERDECEGVVVGESEFWVVSGYGTERQGEFVGSADVYETGSGGGGAFRRVEGVWEEGKCPRGSAGVGGGEGSRVVNWGSVGERVGVCGVVVGGKVVATGSEYPGGKPGFYLGDSKEDGQFVKIDVAPEFSGFVQSGCCVQV